MVVVCTRSVVFKYLCCPKPYPQLHYRLLFKRLSRRVLTYEPGTFHELPMDQHVPPRTDLDKQTKIYPDFYIHTMVLPCLFLSVLFLLVFYLPPDCGESLTLSITNMLALVVFQQITAKNVPPSAGDSSIIVRIAKQALYRKTL